MVIYQLVDMPDGSTARVALRQVHVTNNFIGLGKSGKVNFPEFISLANALEPGLPNKRIEVVDI